MAADRPTCYRCDRSPDAAHRIQLSATHEGAHPAHFKDVDKRICLDCLAAIGMLAFADADPDRTDPPSSPAQSRVSPIRSLRGGD